MKEIYKVATNTQAKPSLFLINDLTGEVIITKRKDKKSVELLDLLADALNVANHTGRSPSKLMNENDRLTSVNESFISIIKTLSKHK